MNIVISGLTAAGKTTHAQLLAAELGYRYVSAADIILKLSGIDIPNSKDMWLAHFDQLEDARNDDSIDDQLERHLVDLAEHEDDIVFDAWALPWITSHPMVRIWFESDRLSRSWKCWVSQSNGRPMSSLDCVNLMDRKDLTSKDRFARRHRFDLFRDHEGFDLILDNTSLISAPTSAAASKGIAAFAPFVSAGVASVVRSDPGPLAKVASVFPELSSLVLARTPFRELESDPGYGFDG